jgi:predicted transport protein
MIDNSLTDNEVMIGRVKAIAESLNGTVVSYTDHGINARLIGRMEIDGIPITFEFNSYNNKNKIVFSSTFWYREGSSEKSINDYRDYSDRSDQFSTKCDVLSRSNDSMVKSILNKVLTEEYKRQYIAAKNSYIEYADYNLQQHNLKLAVCDILNRDPKVHANPSNPNRSVSNKKLNVTVDIKTNKKMVVSVDVYSLETLKTILALVE